MKRRSFVLFAAATVCFAGTAPSVAQEATPDPALRVAGAVQSFYAQVTRMQSRFQQHYWRQAYDSTVSSRGRLAVQRPGRLRMDYDTPRGQVVVSEAGRFTHFTPEDDGPGQYVQGPTDAVGAAFGILDGTANLSREFRFALAPTASDPAGTDRLVLTPRSAAPYVSIVLLVSREERSRGVIRRMSIQMPNGDWNRFDFSAEQYGEGVSLPSFDFVIPEGARSLTPS